MACKLDRRSFVGGLAAVAATAALASRGAWSSDRSEARRSEPRIRLGVASYSFRKFGQAEVIKYMRELNSPYLNVKDMHLPMTPADAVKPASARYRDAGITLTAAGTIYFTQDDDTDMRSKFEYVKAAGIPVMVAGPTPQTLPRLERFAKEYDIKIAIHNHGPEDKYFPSPLDAWKAIKGMDVHMGLCVDVGHTVRAGLNVPDTIREVGPRVYDVHMKDLLHENGVSTQVAVGDGSLPVEKIFASLQAIGYPGFVDLEYEIHEDNPMPGMIKSFAYMRGVLAGMSGQS